MPSQGHQSIDRRAQAKGWSRRIARCVPFGRVRAAVQEGMLYDYLEN